MLEEMMSSHPYKVESNKFNSSDKKTQQIIMHFYFDVFLRARLCILSLAESKP